MSATPTFTIQTLERRTRHGHMTSLVFGTHAPDVHGWYARVTTAQGGAVDVSQLDGEAAWFVNATDGPTGIPAMVNGFGGVTVRLAQFLPDVAAALDAARDAPI